MARMAREVVPNYPHHVTQRGNRRQKVFFCKDDYRYYIELISEFSLQAGTDIWAYCLMPNHVHLVMVPTEEDGLRSALGEAHRRYTRHINFKNEWRGHLWQERFHSFPMDENYLLSAVRYVERNPVVANLCKHPADWTWSSAGAHLQGEDDSLVRVKPMLDRIGNWESYLSDSNKREDDDKVKLHTRTGRPLGNEKFVHKLESITGEVLAAKRPGRKPVGGK